MITIQLPFKTPTVNHLHFVWNNRVILTKVARELKKEILGYCNHDLSLIKGYKRGLKVTVEIHEDWYTKKGDVKKKDVMNREKFLTDSIFQGLGLDDKYIFEYHIKKVQSSKEFALVKIEVLND